jgi:hypothetical protein
MYVDSFSAFAKIQKINLLQYIYFIKTMQPK